MTVFSDNAYSTPIAIHTGSAWQKLIIPAALFGNQDRWTKDKLPQDTVYGGSGIGAGIHLQDLNPGLTLTSVAQDHFSGPPYYWSPGIDLDEHTTGYFSSSLELTVAPVNAPNVGFEQGKNAQTADDRNVTRSKIVYAADIAQESVYVQQTTLPLNGVNLHRVTLYDGLCNTGSL